MFIEASEYAAEHGITTVQSNDLGTIVFDYPSILNSSKTSIIQEKELFVTDIKYLLKQ
ncbi:MAG: hypothetical protein ACLRPW_00115 [Intestinibacter sp.]